MVRNEGVERRRNSHEVLYRRLPFVDLQVDVCQPDGYLCHTWEECVCSGTAYLYITGEQDYAERITAHLQDVHLNLGFRRVYSDKINAYEPYITTYREDAEGNPVYDWRQVDAVYDRILSREMEPFISVSAIPKALASDPNNTAFDGGNSSPPRDYHRWKAYCRKFTEHLIDRYGERVLGWYFQILNEPDLSGLYWSGTHEQFFATYDYAATAIKEVDRRIRVGPGGFAFARGHLLAAFIDHVTSVNYDPEGDPSGAGLDFINIHSYPLPRGTSIREDFQRIDDYMVSHFGPGHSKGLFISEWNTDTDIASADLRNGAYNAAFIVRQVIECASGFFNDPAKVRLFSFWCHSDIYDEFGPIESEFPDFFGLISPHGIHKPSYNAFKMLHGLGHSRVRVSGGTEALGGIATYNADRIVILIYNCVFDLSRAAASETPASTVELSIENIPWHRAKYSHYRIDGKHSNAFAVWRQMGSPAECDREQLEALRTRMDLELYEDPSVVTPDNGHLERRFLLSMPGVTMIVLIPLEKELVVPR